MDCHFTNNYGGTIKELYLLVNVLNRKVFIKDSIFVSIRDRATIFPCSGHTNHMHEGLDICRAKAVPSFLSYCETPNTFPAMAI